MRFWEAAETIKSNSDFIERLSRENIRYNWNQYGQLADQSGHPINLCRDDWDATDWKPWEEQREYYGYIEAMHNIHIGYTVGFEKDDGLVIAISKGDVTRDVIEFSDKYRARWFTIKKTYWCPMSECERFGINGEVVAHPVTLTSCPDESHDEEPVFDLTHDEACKISEQDSEWMIAEYMCKTDSWSYFEGSWTDNYGETPKPRLVDLYKTQKWARANF